MCLRAMWGKKGVKGQRTAMRTQHILIYGLNRSPTLANFQKIPANLSRVSVLPAP